MNNIVLLYLVLCKNKLITITARQALSYHTSAGALRSLAMLGSLCTLLRMTPHLHIARTLLKVDMCAVSVANRMFFSLLILAILSTALTDKCNNLDGFWYNQLGSEIFLKHSNDGKLIGEYRTAVERSKGSSGSKTHSILLGKQTN